MNWLAENALPIWACGAVALTMALIVYLQTRTNGAFIGMVAVIAVTVGLLLVEWALETPREAVERQLYSLAAAVESNDVAATLAHIASSADPMLKNDVQTLMPLVNIERARILGSPQITMQSGAGAVTARIQCNGFILATVKQNGMKGGQEDTLTMTWVREGDRWLFQSYTSKRNWHRALGR